MTSPTPPPSNAPSENTGLLDPNANAGSSGGRGYEDLTEKLAETVVILHGRIENLEGSVKALRKSGKSRNIAIFVALGIGVFALFMFVAMYQENWYKNHGK